MHKFFIGVINQILEGLVNLINGILSILPDSKVDQLISNLNVDNVIIKNLAYLNYFLPIDFILSTFAVFLTVIALYYLYSTILRLMNAIE